MAYLTIARIAGEPAELVEHYLGYEPVMTQVGRAHGLLVHAVATTPEGLMQVNLWPSRDGSEAAADDPRRLDVVRRASVEIHRDHYDVAHYELFDAERSRA